MNVGNTYDSAWKMVDSYQVATPCLLGADALYHTYPRMADAFSPYPVHVVIDRAGIVRYLANQYDAEALRTAITAALAE